MNKMNKVVEYVKEHKNEIAIAAFVGVVGTACGIIGHKMYISKNYGELIKLVEEHGKNASGETFNHELCSFLDSTTGKMYPAIPASGQTLRDAVSEDLLEYFVKKGANPDTKISGVFVGTLKE